MKQLTIIGNLGADAELKVLNGRECVTFRVADTESYTNAQGQKVEQTTWYDCVLNNNGGQLLRYLSRGTKVMVQGLPQYHIFDSAKYHAKMVGISISVQRVELVGGGSNDSVPRYLFDENGQQFETMKFYFIKSEECHNKTLHDKNMMAYVCDERGFVFPSTSSEGRSEQADGQPF